MKLEQIKFYLSLNIGAIVNPFLFFQSILQSVTQLIVYFKINGELPTYESYNNDAAYSLPFEGEWTVAKGGFIQQYFHSWDFTQRYAYDFVIVDSNNSSSRPNGKHNIDYYAFERKILAPCDGEVVKVKDGTRDGRKPGTGWIDIFTTYFAGNHVIIKHSEKEFSFIAHFQKGSICVKESQKVTKGQVLGQCGNSGISSEPHIHFHLQSSASIFLSHAVPVRFSKIKCDGVLQERIVITQRNVVANY